MQNEQVKFPPPPGLIASLASGFDAVATHILVILIPVLLDLFLWLGPHLRLKQLVSPLLPTLLTSSPFPSTAPDPAALQQISDLINRFNLLSLVRTFPVGATSLMSAQAPIQTPLGAPVILEAKSFLTVFGWSILLVIAGWLLGGLYYSWVSSVSLKLGQRSLWHSLKQTVFLSIIWIVLLMMAGFPALVMLTVLQFVNPILVQVALFILGMLALWLAMPIFFSPHGIFTYGHDAFHAILSSLRMVRFTLPNTGLFLLAVLLVGQGLDFLWRTPPANSWLTLVGIAGHAFVSTALLAASFIYYRDINAWLKVIFEQLKAQATSARV